MRDLIWTVIGIWFIYRIISAIQSMVSKSDKQPKNASQSTAFAQHTKSEKDPLKDEGEYVDFEELN